ncbi:MAG: YIP1 family protein [Methanoculleus sp.]|nr:YIP1 family protein [Methanoculleus sp.]
MKSLGDDLKFFFVIVLTGSLLFTLASFLPALYTGNESGSSGLYLIGLVLLGVFIGLIQGLINGVIILLGVSLIEHFFLLFVNEHKGFEKTMKSVIYALSPSILLFWAAVVIESTFVRLLLLFCFGLISYFGIQTFHEKSKDRAAFVTLATSAVLLMFFSRWIFNQGLLW